MGLITSAAALGAAAQGPNRVQAVGWAGPVFDVTGVNQPAQAGVPGPLDLATKRGTEAHFGAASRQNLTLRSLAATMGDSNQVETRSSFDWTALVGPGTSGLALGDPITLALQVRVDGRMAAGFSVAFNALPGTGILLPPDYKVDSRATGGLRLDLYDLDSPAYEDGAPLVNVNFSAWANAEIADHSGSPSYPNGYEYSNNGHGVALSASTPTLGNYWQWSGNSQYSNSFPGAGPHGHRYEVDTGVLSFSFDTVVGRRLQFQGELSANVYCSGYSPTVSGPSCAGLADFGHTFDAEIVSSVAGVELAGLTPGVYQPVPEPASILLMLAGGAGLLLRRRAGAQASGVA